jgi:tetratricopeptide (TPR) repeat protein
VSSDGKGIESALGSIDEVTDQLREKLGEALQNVEKTSVPLPNVATPSLEALKAFAVARNVANTTGDREQALGLYRRALQLDPQFALAHADMARVHASHSEVARAAEEWRKALALPQRLSAQERQGVELMLMQHGPVEAYFRKADEYLALYPDDYRTISRLATNHWHQRNDFRAAEALARRALQPQNERRAISRNSLGTYLLGQEQYDPALAEFRKARSEGWSGWAEYFARAHDARGQHAEADKVYAASTKGRSGWKDEAAVVTWIDRGQTQKAADAAAAWLQEATAAGDLLKALRARAASATVAVTANQPEARRLIRELVQAVDADAAAADAIFPPASAEIRLLAGLLSAQLGDAAGVEAALRATQSSQVPRDYPTVGQLQQVVMAEQERLAGKPQAAVARLRAMAKRDDALVAVHWALMRAEQAAGNAEGMEVQAKWLATHRGRVFAEETTTEVLRFFNAAISAAALKAGTSAQVVAAAAKKPAPR